MIAVFEPRVTAYRFAEKLRQRKKGGGAGPEASLSFETHQMKSLVKYHPSWKFWTKAS